MEQDRERKRGRGKAIYKRNMAFVLIVLFPCFLFEESRRDSYLVSKAKASEKSFLAVYNFSIEKKETGRPSSSYI